MPPVPVRPPASRAGAGPRPLPARRAGAAGARRRPGCGSDLRRRAGRRGAPRARSGCTYWCSSLVPPASASAAVGAWSSCRSVSPRPAATVTRAGRRSSSPKQERLALQPGGVGEGALDALLVVLQRGPLPEVLVAVRVGLGPGGGGLGP